MRTVNASQRFHSVDNPCPICHGGQDVQGEERCYGFLSSDGRTAYCTNVEGDLDFNDEVDAWPHATDEIGQSLRVNGRPMQEDADEIARLALVELAREKGLPSKAFKDLGVRNHAGGVLFGGKRRFRDRKFEWLKGRTPSSDPLFPMPGDSVAETVYITAGETDAVTLRNVGREAYGTTSGEKRSKASLSPGHYRDLAKRGARHVVIAGDGDDHGQAAMRHEAASARAGGLTVSIVDLSPLYDHFGEGTKDLNELWLACGKDKGRFLEVVDEHTREFREVRVHSLDELRNLAESEVPYLISNLLSPGEKMGLTGPPKNYKSWIALNLATAVATGSRFLERGEWQVNEARPVIFIEEEGDVVKFARRVTRAFQDVEHADFFLIQKMGFSLLDPAQVDSVIERVQQTDAGLLVLDPWQRMIVGVDEDKAKETGPAWDEVHRVTLECPRCAVLVLHHANKAGGLGLNAIRGSSRFAGEVDLSMIVKVEEPGLIHASLEGRDVPSHIAESGHLEIRFEVDDPFAMNALGFTVNLRSTGRPSEGETVLSALRARGNTEFTQREIADETGLAPSTVSAHFRTSIEQGAVEKVGRKYRLAKGQSEAGK